MKKKIILIVILVSIIIGTIGYNVYRNYKSMKETKSDDDIVEVENTDDLEEKTDEEEERDFSYHPTVVDLKKYPDVIEKIRSSKYVAENTPADPDKLMASILQFEERTYFNEIFTIDDINNKDRLYYTLGEEIEFNKNLISTKISTERDYEDEEFKYFSAIRWNTLKQRTKLLFGSSVQVKSIDKIDTAISGRGCFSGYKYCLDDNCSDIVYLVEQYGCDVGWRFDSYETQRVYAKKTGDTYEVVQKVLHIDYTPEDEYASVEKPLGSIKLGKVKMESGKHEDVSSYFKQADSYKYTFKLENNNYYFVSSKVIK